MALDQLNRLSHPYVLVQSFLLDRTASSVPDMPECVYCGDTLDQLPPIAGIPAVVPLLQQPLDADDPQAKRLKRLDDIDGGSALHEFLLQNPHVATPGSTHLVVQYGECLYIRRPNRHYQPLIAAMARRLMEY
jgi:hypothetical protein